LTPVLHATLAAVVHAVAGIDRTPLGAISNQSTVAACAVAQPGVGFRTLLGALIHNVRLALAPTFIMHLAVLEWVVAVHLKFAPPLGVVVLPAYLFRLTHTSFEAVRRLPVIGATRVDGIAPGAARQLGLLLPDARCTFAARSDQHQH
jgi:hypothetical protein